ncbi:DUF2827 family protein [Prochlorococcus marinus]|uniref:DUF2827 family protein n=1 Tax=Prochlorococcus marinus TaxID=1219 RepID=UPI0022B42716|nr:DUF2827 family protein [Prochlorococcus marinus]
MSALVKIGITISFNIKFSQNGLVQNIVFLRNLLSKIDNTSAYYIYEGKEIPEQHINKDECISYFDYLKEEIVEFDLIILMGFTIDQKSLDYLKKRNNSTKFISMQCGNQFVENSIRSIHYFKKVDYLDIPLDGLENIWIIPPHKQNITYMKTFYRNNSVKIVPYIWESKFIDFQMEKYSKLISHKKIYEIKNDSVVILEPNLSLLKNCILPLSIVEHFERNYPEVLNSCNVIGGKPLASNHYFMRLILMMDIYKNRNNFLKVHDRKPFVEAVISHGSIVISHQYLNDLNYLYFDALYLLLPLIHNSKELADFGYYYPENDIEIATNQIQKALTNHSKNINQYREKVDSLISQYSPYNSFNIQTYAKLVNNILRNK